MRNNVDDMQYVYEYFLTVLIQDHTITNLFQTNPFGKCVHKWALVDEHTLRAQSFIRAKQER